jgi:hypothetical protein
MPLRKVELIVAIAGAIFKTNAFFLYEDWVKSAEETQ